MSFYVDVSDRMLGVSPIAAVTEFDSETLKRLPASFPHARWTHQSAQYTEFWKWFTGEVWEEKVSNSIDKSQAPNFRFPLKINLIRTAAMKHNYVLFGEVADGPEPMVPIRVRPKPQDDDKAPDLNVKRRSRKIERFINECWMENNGRTLQLEGGLLCQALGGVVFKATWNEFMPDLSHHVKIEMVRPEFFLPVWDSTDPDELLEVFLIWRVPAREAELKYGYKALEGSTGRSDFLMYVEHWTKEKISIHLGGKPLSYTASRYDEDGNAIETETIVYEDAENPFGFIPMVYIPRERAGEYYGIPMAADLMGLAREINARMADMGDVIAESSHRQVFIKNAPAAIRTRDLGGQGVAVDLGSNGPNQPEPSVETVDPPSIPANLAEYPDRLRDEFRRDGFLSAVADGEDEGSQRSALTLAFRMYPLTSKARAVRTYWTNALVRFSKMIARIAIFQGDEGLTSEDLEGVDFYCDWSPMVIRDREQLVNEVVLMLQSNAMTPKTAMDILGYVPDSNEEVSELKKWMQFQAMLTQKGGEGSNDKARIGVQSPVAETGYNSR